MQNHEFYICQDEGEDLGDEDLEEEYNNEGLSEDEEDYEE
jgi:hypothetical protein